MHLKVVVVLLAVGTLTGLFVAASPARAIASIAMDPPQFHPFYYIPGEQIRFTVSILNTDPRTYDFLSPPGSRTATTTSSRCTTRTGSRTTGPA